MIPVELAKKPADFYQKVRLPGLSAIDELVGRPPRNKHPGPRREQVATVESAIPASKFPPFWRHALDDMMVAYGKRCAYLAMHIESTGNPTVDHVVPKSRAWRLVYQWKNYRLCAGVVNSKKGELLGLVDPFEAKVGWFELDLVTCQVVRGKAAPKSKHKKIDATLPLLNLRQCVGLREAYIDDYRRGPGIGKDGIDLSFLERRAPFVASELRRQQSLVRGDL